VARRYWLETLGCPKNQVDSDKLAGRLAADGYRPAAEVAEADLVVVNSCAFIDEARRESLETVESLASQRRAGAQLVVTGCLAERSGSRLHREHPEIDRVAGKIKDVRVEMANMGRTLDSRIGDVRAELGERIDKQGQEISKLRVSIAWMTVAVVTVLGALLTVFEFLS